MFTVRGWKESFWLSLVCGLAFACAHQPARKASGQASEDHRNASVASRPTGAPASTDSSQVREPAPVQPTALAPNHVMAQEDCPPNMVFVPGGHFNYKGPAFETETDRHIIEKGYDIEAFCIDRREVSVHDVFLCPACEVPMLSRYCDQLSDAQTCFSQAQAEHYCGKSLSGHPRRLPRPEEWLYAALGTDGRRFPWGNTWYPWGNDREEGRPTHLDSGKVFCEPSAEFGILTREGKVTFDSRNCRLSKPSLDISPFGVENMGSNVMEWTAPTCTVMGINHFTYPQSPVPPGDEYLVSKIPIVECDSSLPSAKTSSYMVGFRCVTTEKVAAPVAPGNSPANAP